MFLQESLTAAVARLPEARDLKPLAGIILGTGLGGLSQRISGGGRRSSGELPGFAKSTVESHSGEIVWGRLGGVPVVAMSGRFHFYEGHSLAEIVMPVRLMKLLGVKLLVVSNAAGGLNPQYRKGDIVLIEDHINLMGANPLTGANEDWLGPKFPDMIEPYSHRVLDTAEACALKKGRRAPRGVYVAVAGPNLETRAEYRFLRLIGADLVGMSTVPEVIAAVHCGLDVLGVSCVTDMCLPDALHPANIQEIIATASAAEPLMCELVTDTLAATFQKSH